MSLPMAKYRQGLGKKERDTGDGGASQVTEKASDK